MRHSSPIPRGPAPAERLGPCTVRVLGTRLDRYVEFEFSLNDPDLTVELVMPFAAFDEFCTAHGARVLEPGAMEGLPGLYRAPQHHADDTA